MSSGVFNDYIAGALGGCAGLIAGHPFDTIKVQLQTQNHEGLVSCFKKISSSNLSSGFFRGLAFPLWSYGFLNAVFFGVYGNTLRWLTEGKDVEKNKRYFDIYMAGAIAGAAQVIPACPLEVIKVTLQSQIKTASTTKGEYYKGPWHCLKASGMRGCYRGFSGQCLRDIPSFGTYIVVYEWMHDWISEQSWADSRGIVAGLFGGGISGIISWGCIIPLDCIKSRLQSDTTNKYNGVIDCAIKSYKSDGLRCFFRGSAAVSLRAFPVNAITFFVYRETLNELNKLDSRSEVICGQIVSDS
ncbi:solute carrier family 25 member 45-like [Lineus longissimus]|uniref:solute carrier family 25 member 45-like n=1 Tax=Lineus longissimus TaxID=88925 RepID=UPI002B4DB695